MNIVKSIRRMIIVAWKEWLQLLRDSRSLILALVVPVLMVLLFGYALNVDITHVKMAVLDRDHSGLARQFIDLFKHSEYLDISMYVENDREIDRLINENRISLGLVIPNGFEKSMKTGRATTLQLIADGSDSTSSVVAMGYVKAITAQYSAGYRQNFLSRYGITDISAPVTVESRVLYNAELKSKNYIVPGLIVLNLAIISSLITSLAISREWERGTMESLITTPLRSYELVIGKIIPYLFVGIFDVVLCVGVSYLLFRVPFRGNFLELYLVVLLFLVGTSGLGILVSGATKSQVLSVQMAMVATYLPSFILSGFLFPIGNMPRFVQLITHVVPARYLIVLVKAVFLKGISVTMLKVQIAFLFFFALAVLLLSVRSIRMRLSD